ncbi:MAG: TRAP transporter large permease [Sphaerochaeta sp.]|jgi:tripartite ATP-independent transporter DctM subunit|nr:TRAP transporter large permease [Sphaerochaeta sp.]
MIATLGFTFLLTLLFGVPIALVIGITSLVTIMVQGMIPLNAIPQYMFVGLDSFPLLAVPFFILAGELMGRSGISKKLVDFCMVLFGRMPGALAEVNIGVSVFFAGITGAAVADTAAVGSILIPAMKEEGYGAAYSAAVTAASSCIGPIIPPSIILVVYGIAANVSIASLLIAGILPGVLLGVCQGVLAYVHAVKYNYPRRAERFSFMELTQNFVKALPALIMPLIIVGGIMGGVTTATEAAAVAVAYSLIVGFINKSIRLKDIPTIIYNSSITTGIVLLVISTAKLFSIVIVMNQIPTMLTSAFLAVSQNKIVILLMINILLLIVGMFMEISAACIILAPILLPVVVGLGVDPVHFGIIMCVNLAIGLATPPVGPILYVACRIAKVSMTEITIKILPYLGASVVALLLVTFIPHISLFLPSILI